MRRSLAKTAQFDPRPRRDHALKKKEPTNLTQLELLVLAHVRLLQAINGAFDEVVVLRF